MGREYYINLLKTIFDLTINYNTLFFMLLFLGFCLLYFAIPQKEIKIFLILLANMVFYAWTGTGALVIFGLTGIIVYVTACHMERIYAGYDAEKEQYSPKEQVTILSRYKKKTRTFLLIALFCIMGIWLYAKIGKLLEWDAIKQVQDFRIGKNVIVPLGISYYSLSSIGYLFDVYRRKVKAEKNYFIFLTASSYFPHIVQGPISRYEKITSQIRTLPVFEFERVCYGFQLMIWGYIKKMVIADRLLMYVQAIWKDIGSFAGMEIFLAIILGVIQLYADFSGCMDIVRGISQVIGIELDENFKQPFFSKSVAEFWRRWHITLGTWFKEYVYMPIFMSPWFMKRTVAVREKHGKKAGQIFSSAIPLMIVWLLTGIWHGTGWDYVIWGIYYGSIIILGQITEDFWKKIRAKLHIEEKKKGYQLWKMFRTGMVFAIGRTFTVTGSLSGCLLLWKRLFYESRLWTLFDGSLYKHGLDQKDFYVAFAGMILMWIVDLLHEKGVHLRVEIAKLVLPLRWVIYFAAIFSVIIFGMYGPGYDAANFAYGAF